MSATHLFAAVGTPLAADETLDAAGLDAHLDQQWAAGMTGVLVGGTMGLMQLLTEGTYRDLVRRSAAACAGCGEVMIGVGDASLARTLDRVRLVNATDGVDGAVVLTPYLWRFSQAELVDYFKAVASASRHPVYLYDLPGMTGTKLELETVLAAARHPNVRGIKCSGDFAWTRQLIDAAPAGFRVIVAQADLVDVLLRHGVRAHLDGIFAVAPEWTAGIARAAEAGDWDRAAAMQGKLSAVLRVVKGYGVFPSFTALLNARGVPGNYAPAPMRRLDAAAAGRLMREPIVEELLGTAAAVARGNGHAAGAAAPGRVASRA